MSESAKNIVSRFFILPSASFRMTHKINCHSERSEESKYHSCLPQASCDTSTYNDDLLYYGRDMVKYMLNTNEIEFIKKKLIEKFKPEMVILFGSQARMDADKNSDIDLLVITEPNGNRRKLMVEMDKALKGLNYARDIIILSLAEYEKDKLIAGTIARYAFKEGRIIYGS